MTVSSTVNRKTFAGNGVTTSFATSPVVFFDTSDLVLTAVTDATGASEALVENTDYTVTGGAGSTGTVSLAGGSSPYGAPAAGVTLVIRRVLPLTQDDDFLNNDINDAEVLEDRLDRLTMIAQQLDEGNDLGVRLSSDETATDALTVLPFDRASKYLGFDASKELVALAAPTSTALTTAYSETLLAAANAAAALTILGVSAAAQTVLDDTTVTAMKQTMLLDKKGADLASAGTLNLDTSTGDLVDVTGTTTVTAITLAEGVKKLVRFTDALTLTDGASLILPGNENITTAAGDYALFVGYAAGVVRCAHYQAQAQYPVLSRVSNTLGADVTLNNTATFFTGPSVSAGTVGTWFVVGTVTLIDTAGLAGFNVKLWDGTTAIASCRGTQSNVSNPIHITLAGVITSPAGNLRISVKDITSTSGAIKFNQTGESTDSTIFAIRIA